MLSVLGTYLGRIWSCLMMSCRTKMSSCDTCECGWESKSKNPNTSSRAIVAHLRMCPLREQKATETKNLPKRGISDIDLGNTEDPPTGPPQKVPWVLEVSSCGWKHLYTVGFLMSQHRRNSQPKTMQMCWMNRLHSNHYPCQHLQ